MGDMLDGEVDDATWGEDGGVERAEVEAMGAGKGEFDSGGN